MAQMRRPGDGNEELTGLHTPQSIRKQQEQAREVQEEQERHDPPHVLKLQRFIEFREFTKLKSHLEELGGKVAEISSETKRKIGKTSPHKNAWDSQELKSYILECARNGNYTAALEFISSNERYILETWVDDYLNQKRYHEAAVTLRDFAKDKPIQKLNEEEIALDEQIDAEILSVVDVQSKEKKHLQSQMEHDRVWSLVHHGYYLQAAELCERLNVREYRGETLEEAKSKRAAQEAERRNQRDTITDLAKFEETPTDVEKRHEAELLRALPESVDEMKTVFKDLPELISHYHHLVSIDPKNREYTDALRGTYELFVDRLFEQKKIVVEERGMISAEESLLELINDLDALGFRLYINHRNKENKLYLMSGYEADPEYYRPVDVSDIFPKDIVLDGENFTEQAPQTLKMDEEKTLTGEEPTVLQEPQKYTWESKVITIKPGKARELREAA
jgi:hypothetical protein